MKASEKYLIGCVTVATAAYLWLIWKYSRGITASLYSDRNSVSPAEPEWAASETGYVKDDTAPGGTAGPFVKGLDYE
jgi:hypothetical protein